jgi:hypothetical protein
VCAYSLFLWHSAGVRFLFPVSTMRSKWLQYSCVACRAFSIQNVGSKYKGKIALSNYILWTAASAPVVTALTPVTGIMEMSVREVLV